MCGIAGVLDLAGRDAPDEAVVRRMLGTIRHRGPDEFGIYLGRSVAMGNARLSIVDLEGGQQPIGNEDGRYWIVFNGEIFNHPELRQDLEARGHRFATHCDTEVIVHLYEEEGPACLRRLNGQFAIALWDEREQSLFLARDRVGVRPLFYTRGNGRLGFASEIKALLAVPGVQAEPDPASLAEVFTYWSPLSPHTCFRGIREVPPGHYLLARHGQVTVSRYWQATFDEAPASTDGPIEPYVEQLRDLLVDATRIRLRADVPVGAYLSGGLDSSLIASFVRDVGVTRLDTFSISFSDPRFDESAYQLRMAEALGTDHQVVYATHADIGRVFPDVVWQTETPLVRTAPAPMFLLSKLVRDHRYKVVLTGEGADEFLAGYDIFKEAKVRRFWARQPT
jgi:asparagine synthase (glutamine-hydrolysing)